MYISPKNENSVITKNDVLNNVGN